MSDNDTLDNSPEEVEEMEKLDPSKGADAEKNELASLKTKAKIMGISHHPSIGLDKLREKVNAQLNKSATELTAPVSEPEEKDDLPLAPIVPVPEAVKRETPAMRKMRLRKKASLLVRIRITCMNPNKKAWRGEIFTVSNSTVGTFKKFVPFGNDTGWHIPTMMMDMIKDRKFVEHYISGKDSKGRDIKRSRLVREFAVEILDPLTQKELDDLRVKQAISGTVGKD